MYTYSVCYLFGAPKATPFEIKTTCASYFLIHNFNLGGIYVNARCTDSESTCWEEALSYADDLQFPCKAATKHTQPHPPARGNDLRLHIAGKEGPL